MTTRAVVVAHRATMVAEGIAAALSRFPGIVPIAVATSAEEGERQGVRADAVAFDQYLRGSEAAALRLRRRGVRVVFLGEGGDEDEEEGARVSTRAPISSLASALVPGAAPHRPSPGSDLSRREREVLGLVAEGLAAKQIARALGISPKTVEQHKSRIFAKLGVRNQAAAVHVALKDRMGKEPWSRSNT